MPKGPLGFSRPIGIGPLTDGNVFSQPQNATQMGDEVEEIADSMDVDITTEDPDEIQDVLEELSTRVFPDSERKQQRLVNCVTSDWGEDWSDGLLESTGSQDSTPLEEVSMAASGCKGMVEANTLG